MRKESLAFLEELVTTPSPTSYETRGQRVWLDYVSQFADETTHDAYGNCVATLNKGGGPRIMLAGHADEIALSVNYIDDDGFLWVKRMGLRFVGPDGNGAFRSYMLDYNALYLVMPHPNGDGYYPGLAKEWAYGPDGRPVYFRLHPDAR